MEKVYNKYLDQIEHCEDKAALPVFIYGELMCYQIVDGRVHILDLIQHGDEKPDPTTTPSISYDAYLALQKAFDTKHIGGENA